MAAITMRWVMAVRAVAVLMIAVVLSAPAVLGAGAMAGGASRPSTYWGGFAMYNTGKKLLTHAAGSWVVPQVTCAPGENSSSGEWLGMGGEFVSWFQRQLGSTVFEPLYQAGDFANCKDGQPQYQAWEQYFAPEHRVRSTIITDVVVEPYDTMSLTLSASSKGHGASWSLTDTRSGAVAWTKSGTWSRAPSGFHTAECVVEQSEISGHGHANVPNFGVVYFNGCTTSSAVAHAEIAADTSAKLPGHWSRKQLEIYTGGKVRAVPALSPDRVVYGSSTKVPSLPASQLLSLFSNSTLPTGVCDLAPSAPSAPIPISGQGGALSGATGSLDSPGYYDVTVDTPTAVSLGDGKPNEVAAPLWCSGGGTAAYSGVWVFTFTEGAWQAAWGPLPTRTYEELGGTNDFGAGVTGLSGGPHTFTSSEEYGEPGDCGGCASGKATTTWTWSPTDPHHLVISMPAPTALKVLKAVTPTALGGSAAMGNQVGPAIAAGASVPAECTGQSSTDGNLWVELDTGGWIPGADVSSLPPDCDSGQAVPVATACSSSDLSSINTAIAGVVGPGATTTISNSGCAGSWALVAGQTDFGAGGSPPEVAIALLQMSGGQWTLSQGPDDGTCLVEVTSFGCPVGGAAAVAAIPPLVMGALTAQANLIWNPATGTVTGKPA